MGRMAHTPPPGARGSVPVFLQPGFDLLRCGIGRLRQCAHTAGGVGAGGGALHHHQALAQQAAQYYGKDF